VVVRMGPSPGGSLEYMSELVAKVLDGLPKSGRRSQN